VSLEWAFDSANSEEEALSFLQTCIGLEALLAADDQEEPLGKRLVDRCAYLLGTGAADRDSIRDKFLAVYAVRSKEDS